jgi:cytidylate kinase
MKTLIFIVGPNGVGKSTTCVHLHTRLLRSSLVESEWCRRINPFELTPEVERLAQDNMTALLRSYLRCSLVDYVIVCYGLHGPRRRIFDSVMSGLGDVELRLLPVVLTCDREESVRRMLLDGRDAARIERALQTRSSYEATGYSSIDTTCLTVEETVDRILELLQTGPP